MVAVRTWGARLGVCLLTLKPGWRFVRWTGECVGWPPACVVTMDEAQSVTARFVRR